MHAIARYVRNIWDGLYTTVAGMRVTFKYLHSPVTTLQYPDERMPMFERFRGLLHNRIEDCIGCGQCVRACPVDCITMVTQKAAKGEDLGQTRDGQPKKLHVYQFDIDTLKCMWCNLCTEVCPTECLTMSQEYEVASGDRESWMLRFAIEPPPADFDLESWRLKQNRITNPVTFRGAADPAALAVPAGSTRPTSAAGVHDQLQAEQAAAARAAAEKKRAAAEKKQAAAAAEAKAKVEAPAEAASPPPAPSPPPAGGSAGGNSAGGSGE